MGYDLEGLRRAMRANAKRRGKKSGHAPTISRGLTGPQIRAASKAAKRAEASAAEAEKILLRGSKKKTSKRKTSHRPKKASARRAGSKRKTSKRKSSKRKSTKRRGSKRKTSKRKHSKRKSSKRKTSKRKTSKRRGSKRRGRRGWSAAAASGRTVAYPIGRLFDRQSMRYTAGTGPRGAIAANFLASKGPGSSDLVQVVQLRPGSKRGGYPSYVSGFIAPKTIQRKFTFGGAAKRAHSAGPRWRAELHRLLGKPKRARKSSRRGSKRASAPKKNSYRRHHMARKRRHTRRNPKYVVVRNKHRRRRVRRNQLMVYGKDFIKEVAVPGTVATGGFIAANALANAAATNDSVRNILDAGKTPEQALMTKTVVNGLGIVAAMGVAQWMRGNAMIADNATPALTGMGLSLVARLLRGVSQISPYLGRFGEYVEQPMGEYVEQPMGAYVNDPSHGVGEYVEQPMSGLGATTYYAAAGLGGPTYYAAAGYAEGIDPANQDGVDGLMDVMEAAAGTPAMQAAAGMGMGAVYYAAAGLGADAPGMPPTLQQPPFVSQQTPVDMAKAVTATMPYDRPIPTSLMASEGRGHAGGLFARNLFAGMF